VTWYIVMIQDPIVPPLLWPFLPNDIHQNSLFTWTNSWPHLHHWWPATVHMTSKCVVQLNYENFLIHLRISYCGTVDHVAHTLTYVRMVITHAHTHTHTLTHIQDASCFFNLLTFLYGN
jgi:hypothetical protein